MSTINRFVFISSFLISNSVLINFIAKTFYVFNFVCVSIVSLIISWFIANWIYGKISSKKILVGNKAILITGCDSGFGHRLAVKCDKLGFHVFAGVLDPNGIGAQDLMKQCSQKLKVLKLDVTFLEDVTKAVETIKQSELPLWAVVNNAGISVNSPIEWGQDVKDLTNIFNVNVFGAVRVSKLSLPLLRQSKGRIINVSSIAGRMTFTGITYYCMSKHAVRSFSDGLRKEVEAFDIDVINIEPVLYRTNIADWDSLKIGYDRVWNETPQQIQSVYSENFRNSYERYSQNFLKGGRKQTEEVIETMTKALVLAEPQTDYKCGGIVDMLITFPLSHLPNSIQSTFIKLFLRNKILTKLMSKFK